MTPRFLGHPTKGSNSITQAIHNVFKNVFIFFVEAVTLLDKATARRINFPYATRAHLESQWFQCHSAPFSHNYINCFRFRLVAILALCTHKTIAPSWPILWWPVPLAKTARSTGRWMETSPRTPTRISLMWVQQEISRTISFPRLKLARHWIFYFGIVSTGGSCREDAEASCLIRWCKQGSHLQQSLVTVGPSRAGQDRCMHWWGCARWLKVRLKSLSTITSPSNTIRVRSWAVA